METTLEQIAARAYQRFLERGGEHGHDVEDWLAAKEELERGGQRYDVRLLAGGPRVIEVVRTIRDLTSMPLREVEDIVDTPPATLRLDASAADAEMLKARLEALGARIEIVARD
jgi:ribosomal protein L7/L12